MQDENNLIRVRLRHLLCLSVHSMSALTSGFRRQAATEVGSCSARVPKSGDKLHALLELGLKLHPGYADSRTVSDGQGPGALSITNTRIRLGMFIFHISPSNF